MPRPRDRGRREHVVRRARDGCAGVLSECLDAAVRRARSGRPVRGAGRALADRGLIRGIGARDGAGDGHEHGHGKRRGGEGARGHGSWDILARVRAPEVMKMWKWARLTITHPSRLRTLARLGAITAVPPLRA